MPAPAPAPADALFEPLGDGRFQPADLTRGPWDAKAQHGGAPAALLGALIERTEPGSELRTARVSFELLRPVPLTELRAEAELTRPGRRVQLVEARLHANDQVVMRATALRLRRAPGSTPPVPASTEPVPPPDSASPERLIHQPADTPGFAGDAVEVRFARGGYAEPGPAVAWLRLRVPAIAAEPLTGLQRALAAADFGNGVSAVLDWETNLFVNPDLTVYLERDPQGEWIGLDAKTVVAEDGTGLAESVLHDEHGRFGRAVQALLIEPRG